MNVNWGKVASVGLNVAGTFIPQIHTIEQIAKAVPALRGAAKEDAVVTLGKEALEAAEGFAGKEVLSDPEFDSAIREFVRSYVALQNVVNTKPAATQGQASGAGQTTQQ